MVGSETRYQAFLKALGKDQLRRELTPVDPSGARSLQVGGKAYVNLASNDYLALRFHEALIARSAEWAGRYGTGSGASRLVTGNLDFFEPIEVKVARLKQKPAALLMASGFQANAAVLQALFDRSVLGPSRWSSPTGSITPACILAARRRACIRSDTAMATPLISPIL